MGTRDLIAPILRDTYGESQTVEAMADDLAAHIDGGANERDILNRCWDWMSGGSTAESVARKIMDAHGRAEGRVMSEKEITSAAKAVYDARHGTTSAPWKYAGVVARVQARHLAAAALSAAEKERADALMCSRCALGAPTICVDCEREG